MTNQKQPEQQEEPVRDGFTKPGDKPGTGEEMTKKTSRRGESLTDAELKQLEKDSEDE